MKSRTKSGSLDTPPHAGEGLMFMHNGRNRIAAKQRPHNNRKARGHATDHPPKTESKRAKRREEAKAKARAPLNQTAPTLMAAPSFPTGLVAPKPLGVAITSVAVPPIAARVPVKVEKRKARAQPHIPADTSPPAITLPVRDEPLVAQAQESPNLPDANLPDERSYFAMPETALPRARALAKPSTGLVGAIGAWLHSMGKLIASGFLVKKRRPAAPPIPTAKRGFIVASTRNAPEPSMRERTELTQLRAENRRLRSQLEAIEAMRNAPGAIPRWNAKPKQDAE